MYFIDWLKYYQQPYVLSSLNQFVSNIDHEIWRKSGSNTNVAEAAHSMVNREGKQLKLLSAILRLVIHFFDNFYLFIIIKKIFLFYRGKKFDERCYKTIEIHDTVGVPYTHRDKSEIKRIHESITRKGNDNMK